MSQEEVDVHLRTDHDSNILTMEFDLGFAKITVSGGFDIFSDENIDSQGLVLMSALNNLSGMFEQALEKFAEAADGTLE